MDDNQTALTGVTATSTPAVGLNEPITWTVTAHGAGYTDSTATGTTNTNAVATQSAKKSKPID